ncbi:MAG: hypothetical protein FD175_2902 [Beijerinckiaceae bacterium]|nr:MAG: hypothetical protein FD175_2902 [Beijerinckiaceae bacterium]
MRISIAIPTRERAIYLKSLLATCSAIRDDDLEIIVSDNASEDNTREVVESFGDSRIRYLNTGRRLSMRQNFENVINATTGDYVIMSGDDDGFLPGQWAYLRTLLEQERPACLSWRSRYYLWPDARQPDGGGRIKLYGPHTYGPVYRVPTAKILSSIVEATASGHDVAPMIYHGAARRDVIDAMRAKTGEVFSSSIPDVYFSVAANAFAGEVLFVEHPLSVQAISPKSTGFSARFSSGRGDSGAINRFTAELSTDTVVDPMPGKMAAIELYYINAIEQANRMIFDGKLAVAYPVYFARALKSLSGMSEAEREAGKASLRGLAETLPDREALLAAIEQSRPMSVASRALRDFDNALKRFRRFQPSLITASMFQIDLKPFGLSSTADVARTIDYCLGARIAGARPDAASDPSLWRDAFRRGRGLCYRSILRCKPPAALLGD